MQTAAIQTVNDIGQITLGRHLAGQKVMVEAKAEGVWYIHTADAVPENEQWFHDPAHKKQFDDSMAWIASHPASDANTDAILTQLATKD